VIGFPKKISEHPLPVLKIDIKVVNKTTQHYTSLVNRKELAFQIAVFP
jgi:hypothetical protein